MPRNVDIDRKTNETDIRLSVALDGTGISEVQTGLGFLDHMLQLFARHALIDLRVTAKGDLHVDPHHTTEDIGICLGDAIAKALGDKSGIARYGHVLLPMDETLMRVAIDLSGRSFLVYRAPCPTSRVGDFDTELLEDFWQAFASNLKCNLHIVLDYGRNSHHICEAAFKGVARALRMSMELDPRSMGIPSTKGTLS